MAFPNIAHFRKEIYSLQLNLLAFGYQILLMQIKATEGLGGFRDSSTLQDYFRLFRLASDTALSAVILLLLQCYSLKNIVNCLVKKLLQNAGHKELVSCSYC